MITLLAIVTLFAGCTMTQGPQKPLSGSGKIAQVQVTIGSNARTLLPNDIGFSKYILSAEPAAGNTATPPSPVQINVSSPSKGSFSGSLFLSYGEWIITATAYVKVNGIDYAAAKGSASLTVNNSSHEITVPIYTPEGGGTGIFAYTVRYPSNGTALVKLQPWPFGPPEAFNEAVNSNVPMVKNVSSGIHFLSVSVTVNSKTVTRNEIVHIYQHSTTNAEYIFTTADFEGGLNLSGTVKVLVNGQQPEQAYVYIPSNNTGYSESIAINFTGNDGSGTWSVSLGNLFHVNTLVFVAGLNSSMAKEMLSIPIPVDDMTGIDLGTAAWNINPLPIDTWVDGNITTKNGEDWYSINVSAGEMYHFWFNRSSDSDNIPGPVEPGNPNPNDNESGGDGTKTLDGYFYAYYSDGDYAISSYGAWNNPARFLANDSGTVYIMVEGYNTGTYAIAYSTNSHWHNNSFPPANAIPLTADVWVEGEITRYLAGGGGNKEKWSLSTDWYSINVTAGTTYYLWMNSAHNDSSYTLEGYFPVYYSNGYEISAFNYAHGEPFTAYANDTVYIRITGWGEGGTYALMYSDTPKSVAEVNIKTAFDTNSRLSFDSVYSTPWGCIFYITDTNRYTHTPEITYTLYIDGVLKELNDDDIWIESEGWDYRQTGIWLATLSAGMHYGLITVTIDGAIFAKEFVFQVYQQ